MEKDCVDWQLLPVQAPKVRIRFEFLVKVRHQINVYIIYFVYENKKALTNCKCFFHVAGPGYDPGTSGL